MSEDKLFEPELGQFLYSLVDSQTYDIEEPLKGACEAIRNILEVLLDIDPFANGGEEYRGPNFHIQAYSWAECDCETCWEDGWSEDACTCGFIPQTYNLYWEGIDGIDPIAISWYKYFGRGTSVNRKVTNEEVGTFMLDIIHYIADKEK